jgi:hypothetical protein
MSCSSLTENLLRRVLVRPSSVVIACIVTEMQEEYLPGTNLNPPRSHEQVGPTEHRVLVDS